MSGRKRHLLVDTQGLILQIVVHAADIADRDGAHVVLDSAVVHQPRLTYLWADAGYQGPRLRRWTARQGWTLEIVRRRRRWVWVPKDEEPPPYPKGFQVLPRRWVCPEGTQRTFAWLGRYRRLSKDYEALPQTTEAWCYLALSRLMAARLSGRTRPEHRPERLAA